MLRRLLKIELKTLMIASCATTMCIPVASFAQARGKGAASASAVKPVAPNAAAVAEAVRALDDNLLDYQSARFRSVRLMKSEAFSAFCGEINVKNRMGGYNGWRRFMLPLGNEGVAGLYDKPTIEGERTTAESLFNTYGAGKSTNGTATRMIDGKCGPSATPVDEVQYADLLSYKS